jgi:nitrogenase molybdenum-iron protein alpha/beta subunit
MENYVIDLILSEKHVLILKKENLLSDLVKCSKDVVIENIINYINKSNNEEIKNILKEAYKDKLYLLEISNDNLMIDKVNTVSKYTYDSIHAGLTIEELNIMKNNINSLLNKDYTVPYINVIPSNIISGIINTLLALNKVNKDKEYKILAYNFEAAIESFRDKPRATAKGTIFKPISKINNELVIMVKGIDFLINQKTLNLPVESWRYF